MKSVNENTLHSLREIMGQDFSLLITTYIQDSEKRLSSMIETSTQTTPSALARVVHSLKGSSLNIGAEYMANLCDVVEQQLVEGGASDIGSKLKLIEEEFSRVKTQLLEVIH